MSYIIAIGHWVPNGWFCVSAVTRDLESRYYPWIMVGYQIPGYLTSPPPQSKSPWLKSPPPAAGKKVDEDDDDNDDDD